MGDFTNNRINKASINLSRNTPVALVVGAAGFLGSFLVEKLLDHRIQVIGVDDFSGGSKDNLDTATKESYFHLINQNGSSLGLEVERLDYIFLIADEGWKVDNILHLAKEYNSKILFISWIDLYSSKTHLPWFKNTEGRIADFAKEHKLNARVLRLSAVYGPRMNFSVDDPIISLIKSTVTEKITQEGESLDFSSRALFVEDAVNLIVKSMLSGGTALKIFDGASSPVKVTEVKQILLDPIWHENKGFTPSELPPWPTPNLEKTKRELHWEPKINLVEALKKTLNYFKDHEFKPRERIEFRRVEERIENRINEEREEVLEDKKVEEKSEVVEKEGKGRGFRFPWRGILALMIIFYGLVYPLMAMSLGIIFLNFQEKQVFENLKKGNFNESLVNLESAKGALDQIRSATIPFLLVGEYILTDKVREERKNLELKEQILIGSGHYINGVKSLAEGFSTVSGQASGESLVKFEAAKISLKAAEGLIIPASLDLKDTQIKTLSSQVIMVRQLADFLPEFFGTTPKNYLFVVADNNELRPVGGTIRSLALISFDSGKLKKITNVNLTDIMNAAKLEPPKEIKGDLGENSWTIKNANWEPDFPSTAKQIETFYKVAGKGELDGVILADLGALSNLISQMGELNLPNKDKVSADSLVTEALQKTESEYLDSVTETVLNKIFFQEKSWLVAESLQKSLIEKHMLFYFNRPQLQSLGIANNWDGSFDKDNLMAVVEANFGNNKANYFLDRSFTLDLSSLKESSGSGKLQVNYTNRSQNNIWPGGVYKNRIRVYAPSGTKLIGSKWGVEDITTKVQAQSDYNLVVYSMLISLDPGETKALTLDLALPANVKNLNFLKQAGTGSDSLTIRLPGGKVIHNTLIQDQKIEAF